jgi:hypothetical protein
MYPHTNLCKSILLVLSQMVSLIYSQAQIAENRWVYIKTGEDGTKVYLERSHKDRANGIKAIWVKYIKKDGSHDMHLIECDCQQDKYRVTEYVEYNRFGSVNASDSMSNSKWETVVPESLSEVIVKSVCEIKSQTGLPQIILPIPRRPIQAPEIPKDTPDNNGLPRIVSPLPRRAIQEPSTSKDTIDKDDIGVDYAIVAVTRANLREDADVSSLAIIEIPKGDLVVLLDRVPVGPWYNVIHVKSNQEGWIHNNTIITNFTKNRKPQITIPGRSTGSYKNPTVEIKNDSDKTMTLKLGETRYSFAPNESRSITLTPGKINFHASAPSIIPNFGEQNFELGHIYTWRFYIVTKRR